MNSINKIIVGTESYNIEDSEARETLSNKLSTKPDGENLLINPDSGKISKKYTENTITITRPMYLGRYTQKTYGTLNTTENKFSFVFPVYSGATIEWNTHREDVNVRIFSSVDKDQFPTGGEITTKSEVAPQGTYVVPEGHHWAFVYGGSTATLQYMQENVTVTQTYDIYPDEMRHPLYGKNILGIGSSIMYGIGIEADPQSTPSQKVVYSLLANKHHFNFINYGISGSTIAHSEKYPMSERYADNIDEAKQSSQGAFENIDYVIVMGGGNDFSNNIPIGTNSDIDNTTFKGSLRVLIEGLMTKLPKAQILFQTTFNRKGYSTTNTLGLHELDYVNAMLEICTEYSIPCFDYYHDAGFSFENTSQKSWMDTGNVFGRHNLHLTAEANEWLMPVTEQFILRSQSGKQQSVEIDGVATEEYVNEKTKELSKVYVNSEQPTDFTDKDIWVDTSDSQMPVISAGSTTVALGGEVYDAIQEALGSVETELETITTGGGVE